MQRPKQANWYKNKKYILKILEEYCQGTIYIEKANSLKIAVQTKLWLDSFIQIFSFQSLEPSITLTLYTLYSIRTHFYCFFLQLYCHFFPLFWKRTLDFHQSLLSQVISSVSIDHALQYSSGTRQEIWIRPSFGLRKDIERWFEELSKWFLKVFIR